MFAQAAPPAGGQFGGQAAAAIAPSDPGVEQAAGDQGGIDPSLAQAEPELDTVPDDPQDAAQPGAAQPGVPQPGVPQPGQPQQIPIQPVPVNDGVQQ
jgi:arginine/serine-rich splicing factor 15